MHVPLHVCVCVGGGCEVCANFILGVINTCENFGNKAKVTNIECYSWHEFDIIVRCFLTFGHSYTFNIFNVSLVHITRLLSAHQCIINN